MVERVVPVRLVAKVDGFVAPLRKAKASVDDLTKAASPAKADAFGKLADKAALAGVGVATAVGVAVKRFADFDQAMSAVKANSGATGAEFDKLRALRKTFADAMGVPPYVVFSDATLAEMAADKPTDKAALLQVNGVGATKLEKYGEAFLDEIRTHTYAEIEALEA